MKTLAALLLAAFVLAGCGASLEKQVVGNWKVDTAKTTITGEAAKDEAAKTMMMSMLGTVTLDVKEDKTFELNFIMPVKGTWAITDNKLVLTPTVKPGETVSFGGKDTMDFTVDAGGKSMSMTITDPKSSGTLVMVKSEPAK